MFYMYKGLFSRRFFNGSVYSSVVPEFSFFSSFLRFPSPFLPFPARQHNCHFQMVFCMLANLNSVASNRVYYQLRDDEEFIYEKKLSFLTNDYKRNISAGKYHM